MSAIHSPLLALNNILSQIFFMHPLFVPATDIFDFPSGCPNPCCTEDCEMICFPRHGLDSAAVLPLKRGYRHGSAFRCVRAHEMYHWIDCDVVFSEEAPPGEAAVGEGSECSSMSTNGKSTARPTVA